MLPSCTNNKAPSSMLRLNPVSQRWRARLVSNEAPGGQPELIRAGEQRYRWAAVFFFCFPSFHPSLFYVLPSFPSPPTLRDRPWSLTARPPPSLSTPHRTACTEKSFPVEVEHEIRLACRCCWNIGQNLDSGSESRQHVWGEHRQEKKATVGKKQALGIDYYYYY